MFLVQRNSKIKELLTVLYVTHHCIEIKLLLSLAQILATTVA